MNSSSLIIPRVSAKDMSYDQFFEEYMLANKPVIITDISTDWMCVKNWIKINENAINFDYLRSHFKDRLVPIANCSKQYFNSHEKSEISLHKYLEWWQQFIASGHDLKSADLMYLKDWHLQHEDVGAEAFYKVPKYFQSDWLNEYLIGTGKQDYRFVYFGPKGSWTPFHSDVFSSFSWSTNIVGKKRWVFLAAGEEKQLLDKNQRLPFSIEELLAKEIPFYELHQLPNEAVFVPSGWHHQVWNMEDTISINHNWFNGSHIEMIWKALQMNLGFVIDELNSWEQIQGSDEEYQVMLKASFGMNYSGFVDILEFIFNQRLAGVGGSTDGHSGDKYLLFDLEKICQLAGNMLREQEERFDGVDVKRLNRIKGHKI